MSQGKDNLMTRRLHKAGTASQAIANASDVALTWGEIPDNPSAIPCDGRRVQVLVFQFEVATQALDALKVYGRINASATWLPLAVAAKDYTDGDNPLVILAQTFDSTPDYTGADLTAIVAGGYGLLVMRNPGLGEIKVEASAAAGTAAMTAWVTGYDSPLDVPAPPVFLRPDPPVIDSTTPLAPAADITIDAGAGVLCRHWRVRLTSGSSAVNYSHTDSTPDSTDATLSSSDFLIIDLQPPGERYMHLSQGTGNVVVEAW